MSTQRTAQELAAEGKSLLIRALNEAGGSPQAFRTMAAIDGIFDSLAALASQAEPVACARGCPPGVCKAALRSEHCERQHTPPAPAQAEPVAEQTNMLHYFTARRVDNAGNTPGFTLYMVKMGAHNEYQLYRNEALALWINLGTALGYTTPPAPAQAERNSSELDIRFVVGGRIYGRPTLHDVLDYIERRGESIHCSCDRCAKFLAAQAEQSEDTALLEWMQHHGAYVAWGRDAEYCSVHWSDDDGVKHRTKLFADWRAAIRAAKEQS